MYKERIKLLENQIKDRDERLSEATHRFESHLNESRRRQEEDERERRALSKDFIDL